MKSHLVREFGAFGWDTLCGKYIKAEPVRRRGSKKCKKCKRLQKKEWFTK